ncbi:hypothetical protein [Streptomyces carpaticus]|uniref:Uncharacterized protein n=1 Tax=Streptomyces carpaticus TaxID=285558 RepID=A0ABV4ZN17_9ACTN
MTASTTAGPCAVTVYYEPLDPRAPDGPDGQSLTLALDGPHPCHSISVHIPPDAADSTDLHPLTRDWETTRPAAGTTRFTPARGPRRPDNDGRLTLRLTGLRPAAPSADDRAGAVEVTVVATAGPAHAPHETTSRHYLEVAAAGETITNFKAEHLLVTKEQTVTLLWSGPDDRSGYRLQTSDQQGKTSTPAALLQQNYKNLGGEQRSYRYPHKLHRTTVFSLLYETTQVTSRALTWVVVEKGDLDAGRLSVSGPVALLGPPQSLLARAKDAKECTVKEVPSDGIVAATLDTSSGRVTGRLTVGSLLRELAADASGTPAHVQLPVPKGSGFSYRTNSSGALSDLTWFPFGTERVDLTCGRSS